MPILATIASKAFPPFHNSDSIAEASCRAETTIALSVTRPVGYDFSFDLQLRAKVVVVFFHDGLVFSVKWFIHIEIQFSLFDKKTSLTNRFHKQTKKTL
jgi:hypothetical protein